MPQLPFIDPAAQLPNDGAALLSSKEDKSNKGVANGYAPLDANAKVPVANLPDTASLDAEVDGKITTHNSATTSVHGIPNTADLATKTYADGANSTHNSATTSVHGIANTANLVLTNDSRLADSRQPTAHTHGNITNNGSIPTADGGKTITLISGGTGYSSGSALINGIAVSISATSGVITFVTAVGSFSAVGAGTYAIFQSGNTSANVILNNVFAENLPLITTTNGLITTGSFGTTANTFCRGNDSRLSHSRIGNNTHVGETALASPSLTGSGNIAIGENTLNKNKNGNNNIAVGRGALENCDSPDANIGVGTQAGKTIVSGGSNIVIGHEADVDVSWRQRCIVLGRNAVSPAIDGSLAIGGTGGNVMTSLTTTTAPTGATGTWLQIWLNGLEYRIPIQRAS